MNWDSTIAQGTIMLNGQNFPPNGQHGKQEMMRLSQKAQQLARDERGARHL